MIHRFKKNLEIIYEVRYNVAFHGVIFFWRKQGLVAQLVRASDS